MSKISIWLGSDHAGVDAKAQLTQYIRQNLRDFECHDLGPSGPESTDYPSYAEKVGHKVVSAGGVGICICGSGLGMSIAANKVAGVRAITAWDVTSARLSREHNDANVLCLGARLTGLEVLKDIAHVWLTTAFKGGHHAARVDMIKKMENGAKPL